MTQSRMEFRDHWLRAALAPQPPRVQIECVRQAWGHLHSGLSVNGTPLCLRGRTFAGGLGTHADSEIRVALEFARAPSARLGRR